MDCFVLCICVVIVGDRCGFGGAMLMIVVVGRLLNIGGKLFWFR